MQETQPTPSEYLNLLIRHRDLCLDNMEGEALPEFTRWEALAVAYSTIITDLQNELAGKTHPHA